jgi:NTP pyrophosphatase (non-canonical NTP hydrolase)
MSSLVGLTSVQGNAMLALFHERKRQDEKWGEQNHSPEWWLAILGEEYGELAQAILETKFGGKRGGIENIREEAVQCAAVALALIECIDRNTYREEKTNVP